MAEMVAWRISTPEELERLFAIRMAVFVDEQKVDPTIEIDAADYADTTMHVLATVDGTDVGTARLIIDGPGHAHVGRMAVHKCARGTGVGRVVMEKIHELALEYATNDDGEVRLWLSGQESAVGFYARLGYEITTGERYLDENIWHLDMHIELRRAEQT